MFLDLILEINGQINRFSKVTRQLAKWAIQPRTVEFSSAVCLVLQSFSSFKGKVEDSTTQDKHFRKHKHI